MKKKFLSVVLVLALVMSFAAPAMAVENTFDLAVNDENPWEDGAFTFEGIEPGGVLMEFDFKLHNVGEDPGVLTFSMSVSESDMAGAPAPNLSADEFASLIYVEAVSYQYIWLDHPDKVEHPDGYIGSVRNDLENWLLIDEFLGNNDGKVSLYEICQAGTIHYDDEDDPLEANLEGNPLNGAEITYFIKFQLSDPGNNDFQGDGVSVTITATLGTDEEQSSGNVFQAAGTAGPVLNVDTDVSYDAIQAAINDANPGDTINAAEGIYNEQLIITESLILQGVGDATVIQPPGPELLPTTSIPWIGGGTSGMSAIVSIVTEGKEVVIQDLMIDGSLILTKSTTWMGGLVYLETSGMVKGVTVNGGSTLPDRTAGIFAAAITNSVNLEVTECTVEVYTRAGIYALGETFTADYHDNEINGPGAIEAGVPNGMFFLEGANGLATYNTITHLAYTGETYRSTGIGTFNAGSDVTFTYNTISNAQNAFALSNNTDGTVIEYNTVFNCHTGVRIESGATNSVIRYNDIHDNHYAIRCDEEMGANNVAHFNSFVNNAGPYDREGYDYAVTNLYPTVFDATNNWWGHSSGPGEVGDGSGNTVSNLVDFEPWLLDLEGPTYDGTHSLPAGWSLVSPDSAIIEGMVVGEGLLVLEYTGVAWTSELSEPSPLKAIYIKTTSGGGTGVNYAEVEPDVIYSKELVAGWNLISIPSTTATTQGILAQLRYATFGTQQGVGLTTLVSQGEYNQHTGSFTLPTLTDVDWSNLPSLNPFDGYWAHLEAPEVFEVIPQ